MVYLEYKKRLQRASEAAHVDIGVSQIVPPRVQDRRASYVRESGVRKCRVASAVGSEGSGQREDVSRVVCGIRRGIEALH